MIPFSGYDGRRTLTQEWRQRAYQILGGKENFDKEPYMRQSLCECAVVLEHCIREWQETRNVDQAGKIIQAINSLNGIYKNLGVPTREVPLV